MKCYEIPALSDLTAQRSSRTKSEPVGRVKPLAKRQLIELAECGKSHTEEVVGSIATAPTTKSNKGHVILE